MTDRIEQIVLGSAVLLVAGVFGGLESGARTRGPRGWPLPEAKSEWRVDEPAAAPDGGSEWLAPHPQPRGAEWIYDLFTPPEIVRTSAGRLIVRRREEGGSESGEATPRLLAVTHALFPVQFVGCAGSGANLIGSFELGPDAVPVLAQEGGRVGDSIYRLDDLRVERQLVDVAGCPSLPQRVAVAEVSDLNTGAVTVLVAGRRARTDELVAVMALPRDVVRELRQGETAHVQNRLYRLNRVELDPPRVDIALSAADAPPQNFQLGVAPLTTGATALADE